MNQDLLRIPLRKSIDGKQNRKKVIVLIGVVTEKNLNGSEKRSLGDSIKDIVYDDAYGEVSLDGGSTPLSSTNR